MPGETLLDVGCGTGWFSRQFARAGLAVTGVDVDEASLAWAASRMSPAIQYQVADARQLPFPAKSFDHVVSVTALCFVPEWPLAIAEIARVCRRRFALGLLNHHTLLWWSKGRGSSRGAYAGAHWHTRAELDAVLARLKVNGIHHASAVFVPSGGSLARLIECVLPPSLSLGAFLAVSGEPVR